MWPGWWWREEYGDTFAVNVREFGGHFGPRLLAVVDGVGIPVVADGCWLAPCLTPAEAAALTARAERAERERDEARHWAEDAAAAENDNAADLRAARATLEAVRAYVDQLERIGWRDLTEQSPDIAHGMNCAGAQLRIILGGSRE